MFVFQNLFTVILRMVDTVANIYIYLIIIRAILSWFSPDPRNQFVFLLIRLTEPVLERIRRFMPASTIDFSPFIAILLIQFVVRGFLIQALYQIIR